MKTLEKLNKWNDQFLFWATVLSTGVFISVVIISIATRFLLRIPILGSIELSRLGFVWACFFGAALCYRRNAHISIGFLVEALPKKIKETLRRGIALLSFLFFLLLSYLTLEIIVLLAATRLPMLEISQAWFYGPLPLIFGMMAAYALETVWVAPPETAPQ